VIALLSCVLLHDLYCSIGCAAVLSILSLGFLCGTLSQFIVKVLVINDVTVDRSSTHSRSIHRNVFSGRIERQVLQIVVT
jgi:hypothetical protein